MSRRLTLLALPAVALAGVALPQSGRAAQPQALLVGTYHGIAGQFGSIQGAIDSAQPGDYVLVGPGDYHEKASGAPRPAGVLITTPGIHLRGMDRNAVVVDGTNPTAARPCDATPAVQDFGPVDPQSHNPIGRNGIEVYKADSVSIENLTVCNYLSDAGGGNGNEIWWNGGDRSGHIGLGPFYGAYLNATETYYKDDNSPMGEYGIFTSNENGPGTLIHTYSSNFGDSSYYIGACPDCNASLIDAHAENSALGYSGTNGSGHLIISRGEWDKNKAGLAPNTLNNDDWPSPQTGACPNNGTGPTGTHSCMVIEYNYIHDNNNPATPQRGIAGAAPIGTGIILPGVENDTVVHNVVTHNGSFGIVATDFPDTETPPPSSATPCRGGTNVAAPGNQIVCYYPAFGNEIAFNTLSGNGFFNSLAGPITPNADLADTNLVHNPGNCFHDNTDAAGLTSDPPQIQTVMGTCGAPGGIVGASTLELVCASGPVIGLAGHSVQCVPNTPGATYPTRAAVTILPLPSNLPTMPDPCAGVPVNPWCNAAATQAPTATPTPQATPGLVNTSAARADSLALIGGAFVLGGLASVGARRRSRRGR